MLARARVVFAHRHLLGQCARVLLGDIEKARVGGAHQLDLDGRRLGHGPVPRKIGTSAGRPTDAAERFGPGGGVKNEEGRALGAAPVYQSEEHTSELQSLMRISYAVFCLKK